MDPPPVSVGATRPPPLKIKKEVKEEPEYIYVDETVCRVKLEESEEEVILPKDDMVAGSESGFVLEGQPGPPSSLNRPARRGRKPRILRASRGNTHSCTTTARKILPRPSPLQVPLTLSHLRPPPRPLPLPSPARNKPPQAPVMVRPTLHSPTPTNSGRKILPWPHQLSPASLAPVSQQQKLQPLNPSLTTCPPSGAQALPLTHLQPINPAANSGLMPLQPLSLTQLRSPPPSSCISQLGVPVSPQKIPVPPKVSRKTVPTLSHMAAGPPTPCTRVPLLPLSEATAKMSSTSPTMQTTTTSHVRKLLPRPLKAGLRPAANTVFQQQQQQGALTAFQQLHPVPVSTQQAVSLQQFESLNPSTTQTTTLALQTLNMSGQPASLSGPSQVVSLQHVRALPVSPPQPPQKVKLSEASLQLPHHLHTVTSNACPHRVTFQQAQQASPISVSQGVAIHPLPPPTKHQQSTTLCQVHTLQSSAGHIHGSRGTSIQTAPTLVSDSKKIVPMHHYSRHAPGDTQTVPQVSPMGSKTPLAQMCSASFATSQSTAPSQAELQNSQQQALTFHEVSSANHILKEDSTHSTDTNHLSQGKDVVSLHVTSRQDIASVESGMPVGVTSNGTVLKVPIQPLRPSASFPRVKRKYLRRNPRELRVGKKKGMPVLKMASVNSYSWPLNVQENDLYTPTSTSSVVGRKILPRPCPSLFSSQVEHVQPVTTQSASQWLVPQVEQHEGCTTVVTSLGSSSVGALTHTAISLSESQLSTLDLPHEATPFDQSGTNSLTTTDQVDTSKNNIEENFLLPVSPAKAVATCSFVPLKEITDALEDSSNGISQEVESPRCSQVTDDNGTKTDDSLDQPCLECTDSCSLLKVDTNCPEGRLSDMNDKIAWNQMEDSVVNLKNDMHTSGDGALDHCTQQVTRVANTDPQLMLQDTSEDATQNYPILQDATGDNSLSQPTSQDTLSDNFQDQQILQNTLSNSTQNQFTSQNTLGDSIQNQLTSQAIQGDSTGRQPTSCDTQEQNTNYQPMTQNYPNNIKDHSSPIEILRNSTVDQSPLQQFSTPSEVVPSLIIPASQTKPDNLKEEKDGEMSKGPLFEDNILPPSNFNQHSCIHVVDQDVFSPSLSLSSSCPSDSRLSEASSPSPPEATGIQSDSHSTQDQNTVCPLNESLPVSCLSQNNSWEPPPSVSNMKEGSLSTSKVETLHTTHHVSFPSDSVGSHSSCPSHHEIMMTRKNEPITSVAIISQDSANCSILKKQDTTAADSSASHPAGQLREDLRVITATTTTVTITTTAVSTITTTSQPITVHTYMEAEVEEESSNLLSQEKMDPSVNIVPTSSHFSEPKCPPACMLVEQKTCHKECQASPEGQRKTWRRHQQQHHHRTMRGPRLRALVRTQRRTIQMLRNKLHREQRRSKTLWEALRRTMTPKDDNRGEVCSKESRVAKGEEEEEITQSHPSPPVTRSRNRPKQVAVTTLSSTRMKKKHKDKSTKMLKKIITLNHDDDCGLEEDSSRVQAIHIAPPTAGKTELHTLVREFMMRDDVSQPTTHGTRQCLHYLPLLHKRFMADCCQPCSLETFQQHLPSQMPQRIGEELETCVCLVCQNPELKVESLVRRRLLPLNTRLEQVAFSPDDTFKEFLVSVQALKDRPSSQLSYSEWFMAVVGTNNVPQSQKKTLTRPLREVATLLVGELNLLRLHLTRTIQQYEATFKAKCEAEQSPQHAVLQAEWSPVIILHALGANGTPAIQRVVSLQCGYLWSHADSLGFIAVSGCRDQRAAAVCASLEPLLTRLIQQGVRCLTLLVDPKTDLSAVLEYTRRSNLEVRWVFSEPGHGAGVAEAVGNSVTQLICDTVNSWGPETVLSAKDVFSMISPNSCNFVYYYSEEDVWRSSQLLHGPASTTKTANKLIKPKTLLSL